MLYQEVNDLQENLYPIWSNVFFLVPVCIGIKNQHYKSSLFLFMSMIFSFIYHTCDNNLREHNQGLFEVMAAGPSSTEGGGKGKKKVWVCWGIRYNSFQLLDFFYARLCISMICMKICVIPKEHKENIFHVYYSLILIITVLNRHNMLFTGSIVSFDLLVPTISTLRSLYYWCFSPQARDAVGLNLKRPYTLAINKYRFIGCCMFFVAGLVCFEESTSNYAVMHSFWHIFMSVSCAIALSQKKTPQQQVIVSTTLDTEEVVTPAARETAVVDGDFDRPYTRQRGLS